MATTASPLVQQLARSTSRGSMRSSARGSARSGASGRRSVGKLGLASLSAAGRSARASARPLASPIRAGSGASGASSSAARTSLSRKLFTNYHKMQDSFHAADPGGRGVVTYRDFRAALRVAGVKMPQAVRGIAARVCRVSWRQCYACYVHVWCALVAAGGVQYRWARIERSTGACSTLTDATPPRAGLHCACTPVTCTTPNTTTPPQTCAPTGVPARASTVRPG